MKTVAILLVLGVFLRHDTAFTLSKWTGMDAPGVFYIEGALLEILLLALLLLFVWHYKPAVPLSEARHVARFHLWSARWRLVAKVGIAIGMVEAAMMAGCRMALTSYPPPGVSQCDHVTGWPVYEIVAGAEILALVVVFASWLWNGRDP